MCLIKRLMPLKNLNLKRCNFLFSICILLKFNILQSQSTPLSINANNAEKYKIHITRTTEPITLDGLLKEAIWQTAEVAQNFWQQKPVDDKPASRRTEVRLAYDDRNIYVAAQANNFNVNSRLQWRFAPMSDLFLVYTDNYQVEGLFGPKDRTLTLKIN
jgi:hypothetical protein